MHHQWFLNISWKHRHIKNSTQLCCFFLDLPWKSSLVSWHDEVGHSISNWVSAKMVKTWTYVAFGTVGLKGLMHTFCRASIFLQLFILKVHKWKTKTEGTGWKYSESPVFLHFMGKLAVLDRGHNFHLLP